MVFGESCSGVDLNRNWNASFSGKYIYKPNKNFVFEKFQLDNLLKLDLNDKNNLQINLR